MEVKESFVKTLAERLEEHDKSRKALQENLVAICTEKRRQTDEMESKINKELEEKYAHENSRLQNALDEVREAVNNCGDAKNLSSITEKVESTLLAVQSYEIVEQQDESNPFVLNVKIRKVGDSPYAKPEDVIETLVSCVGSLDENRKAVNEDLLERCNKLRKQIDALGERINKELEEKFVREDNRLQSILSELKSVNDPEEIHNIVRKAKCGLLVKQSYELSKCEYSSAEKIDISNMYEMIAKKEVVLEMLENKQPINLRIVKNVCGRIYLEFSSLTSNEEGILAKNGVDSITYSASMTRKSNNKTKIYDLVKHGDNSFSFLVGVFRDETVYSIKVRTSFNGQDGEWSSAVKLTTGKFSECCVWKECPGNNKYRVDEGNQKVVTRINGDDMFCTVIGNTSFTYNKNTYWKIKILKSRNNDGRGIFIGVAPYNINQEVFNLYICGWYFDCFSSTLNSGPPHRQRNDEYGPRKEVGQYVHTGDTIGVTMNMTLNSLSFTLGGEKLKAAYEGIPVDKPLVPCVILGNEGDSVELV